MKVSAVADQHIHFALVLIEQLNVSAGQLAADELEADIRLNVPQKALFHSALVQAELAVLSFLEELHLFFPDSKLTVDLFFQNRTHRSLGLSRSLASLASELDSSKVSGFVELFALQKKQNSWLSCLEQLISSLAYTKAEWGSKQAVNIAANSQPGPKPVDAGNLIASTAQAHPANETQQSLNVCKHWSECYPQDLKSCLTDARAWIRSIRSNMDEF